MYIVFLLCGIFLYSQKSVHTPSMEVLEGPVQEIQPGDTHTHTHTHTHTRVWAFHPTRKYTPTHTHTFGWVYGLGVLGEKSRCFKLTVHVQCQLDANIWVIFRYALLYMYMYNIYMYMYVYSLTSLGFMICVVQLPKSQRIKFPEKSCRMFST